MNPTRFKILLGVAAVLLVLLVWHWVSGWGLVTVHSDSMPLAKIIRSIEQQGGIQIVTNADEATPVVMDVDRVPPAEAVDVLAAHLDGNWSVAYVAGATKADIINGIAALKEGERNGDYARFGFGGGGFGMMDVSDTVIDVRRVSWKVSPSDDQQIQAYLDQLSQKTGVTAVVPRAWNPTVAKLPAGGPADSAIRSLVRSVGGQVQDVFVIRIHTEDPNRQAAGGDRSGGPPRTDGGFAGGGGPPDGRRGNFHPEWMEERVAARIEQLPAGEREQAKKDVATMRDFFQQMRALPEDQRRAAMEKFFDSPVVQERMAERMAARDEKSGPVRRAERARQYIQRKQAAKTAATQK